MVKIGFLHFTKLMRLLRKLGELSQMILILQSRREASSSSTTRRHFNPMKTKVLSGEFMGQKFKIEG
jgi:hypothetical protein